MRFESKMVEKSSRLLLKPLISVEHDITNRHYLHITVTTGRANNYFLMHPQPVTYLIVPRGYTINAFVVFKDR